MASAAVLLIALLIAVEPASLLPTRWASPATIPAPIPSGWAPVGCNQDSGSRILRNVKTSILANNTPSNCIDFCDSMQYDFAGVEYSTQCFCGTEWTPGTPQYTTVDPSMCCLPCSGNPQYTCGGNWFAQLYSRPKPSVTFPDGWDVEMFCAIDTPSRIIADDATFLLSNNTPTVCMETCEGLGYTFAGVEYGNECHCGNGLIGDPQPAYAGSECGMPCSGSNHYYCGDSWKIQVYSSVCTTE